MDRRNLTGFARKHWLLLSLAIIVLLVLVQYLLFGGGSTKTWSS
jgi:hypothetical protein